MARLAARARLAQALVCPYCRDRVAGAVAACARPGCGAVYHETCFDECAREHGGCAIMGCGSRERRKLSMPRRYVWIARLLLAALLVPSEVARTARATRGRGILRAFLDALKNGVAAFGWYLDQFPSRSGPSPRQTALALPLILVHIGLVLWITTTLVKDSRSAHFGTVLMLGLFAPAFVAGFAGSLGLALLHGLARAFATELDSLDRNA